jgi:hypothetical protein
MTLTIELDPVTLERLRREAERRMLRADELARTLIEAALPEAEPEHHPDWDTATPEQRLKAFHEMLERLARYDLPSIPDEALRRENMYEDRV